MTDWKEPLGWIGEMVTGVPHSLTVAEAEEDASKGMYWPISGDDTIKANQGKSRRSNDDPNPRSNRSRSTGNLRGPVPGQRRGLLLDLHRAGDPVTGADSALVDMIAEVQQAHERKNGIRNGAIHCTCGWSESVRGMRSSRGSYAAHQARAVLAAISEAGAVEWATEHVAQGSRTIEIHPCDSEADAQGAIAYYGGRILSRITGPWERAE